MSSAELRYGLPPGMMAASAILIIAVGGGAWFAGLQHGKLQNQQLVSVLTDSEKSTTQLQVALQQEQSQVDRLGKSLQSTGKEAAAAQTDSMRREILRLQAGLSAMESVSGRDQKEHLDNSRILQALSSAGVQLVPLDKRNRNTQGVVYALLEPEGKVVMVASHLAPVRPGMEYRVWLTGDQERTAVSAGTLAPDDAGTAVFEFDGSGTLPQVASLVLMQQPAGERVFRGERLFSAALRSKLRAS